MMGFMKKKAASTIVDQALNGLKKRVERGARAPAAVSVSGKRR